VSRPEHGLPARKLHKYDASTGAASYQGAYQQRLHRRLSNAREHRLLRRYLAALGRPAVILDVPCGHGRLSALLRDHCEHLVEADWSRSMVRKSREDHGRDGLSYLRCSALELPLRDGSADLVVSVRLSHHLPTAEHRERHLRELFRVARRGVIVTWFSHHSLKNVLRLARARRTGKRPKNTLRSARVEELARACGFRRRAARPLFVVGSGHVLGCFERESAVGGAAGSA
jgi:ubiquinone/menaquinone biosynthesis C-methylase UbiE